VEISSHYPYYTARLSTESQEQTAGSQQAAKTSDATAPGEVDTQDRLDLVRTQNLASPIQEPVDLSRAADLLQQVQGQMQGLDKQDAQNLYQYDRLRDLMYRVSQPQET
jgi:hypothetical protein